MTVYLRHKVLEAVVPSIYACATTGSRRAWLAPYDDKGRQWGEPAECALAVSESDTCTRISFHPLPTWKLPKRRLHPPMRLGVIVDNPANDPVWFQNWFSEPKWVRLNPQRGELIHVTDIGISAELPHGAGVGATR